MNRYEILKNLGDGTYGQVYLARNKETQELIAIKKMKKKYYDWNEALNLREVRSLRKLQHLNVVKLREVVREKDVLYLMFEYMHENLYQMTKDRKRYLPETAVRNITFQILKGLAYLHKIGYFHRDLKPENLLCNGPDLVKIADFGLAREIRSKPPYTDYVSTRWYRAPEILLRSVTYSAPVDMWALGCIIMEVWSLRPLFPGSSELDQLFKICTILGIPDKNNWPEGHKLAQKMNFKWPVVAGNSKQVNLSRLCPPASEEGMKLISDLLLYPPRSRPTAEQCLKYAFFDMCAAQQPSKRNNVSQSSFRSANSNNSAVSPVKRRQVKNDKQDNYGIGQRLTLDENKNLVKKTVQQPQQQVPVQQAQQINSRINSNMSVPSTPDSEAIDHFLNSIPSKPNKSKKPLNIDKNSNNDHFTTVTQTQHQHNPIPKANSHNKPKVTAINSEGDTSISNAGSRKNSNLMRKNQNNRSNSRSDGSDLFDVVPAKVSNASKMTPKQHYLRNSRYFPGAKPANKMQSNNNNYNSDLFQKYPHKLGPVTNNNNNSHNTHNTQHKPTSHINHQTSNHNLFDDMPSQYTTTKNNYQQNITWKKNANEVQYRKQGPPQLNQTYPNQEGDLDNLLGISKVGSYGNNNAGLGLGNYNKMNNNNKTHGTNSVLNNYPNKQINNNNHKSGLSSKYGKLGYNNSYNTNNNFGFSGSDHSNQPHQQPSNSAFPYLSANKIVNANKSNHSVNHSNLIGSQNNSGHYSTSGNSRNTSKMRSGARLDPLSKPGGSGWFNKHESAGKNARGFGRLNLR